MYPTVTFRFQISKAVSKTALIEAARSIADSRSTGCKNPERFAPKNSIQHVLSEGEYVNLLSDGNQWVPSGKMTFDAENFFLPTSQIDPFGNQTTFTYDSYKLLLTQTEDALGNTVQAQYDYRLLQPDLVTDPNGNRQAFAFDVRGMVTKLAVMGKVGDSDGDDLTDPATEFSYDLFAWMNATEPKTTPNWAKTESRETHGAGNARWMESTAYSDGMGNVVMTKVKVAPDPVTSDPRWIGTGRTILNNKGNPVKQYEPYFSDSSDFETEAEIVEFGVTPIIYYDPLGRAIRTEMPDDTLTRVEFTPWEQRNFDQNDTVLESLWYTARIGDNEPEDPEPSDSIERSAWLTAKHANTPQIIILDVLGRPFITIDRLTSGTSPEDGTEGTDFYKMTTELDILGNPLSITDAKGRTSFTYTYNVLGQPIKTTHIDNGVRYAIGNVVGNPLRAWDGRKQQFRFSYDELLRPKGTYLTPDYDELTPGDEQLLQLTVYGEEETDPEDNNLRGQAYILFDPAGMVKNTAFDFKGNLLSSERQLAVEYQTSPDWMDLDGYTSVSNLLSSVVSLSLLESEVFTISTEYDALNRPISMIKPDDSEVIPTYDDGGQLLNISTKLQGAGTATPFVSQILYNERGQRDKIVYSNGSQTRYIYDTNTFRLIRLLTTRNTGADILQDLNYTYDPVGNIVEQVDDAQSTNYYDNSAISANGKYEYDPLYRLLKSEGRELIGLNAAPSHVDIDISPLNETALRRYTQQYVYDELGNILQLAHTASGGNWNRYYHYAANNYLLGTSPDNDQPTIDEYEYDAHGNMITMPHLSGGMTWDFADRLQSAANGTQTSYYTYDAGGNRVRKVVDKGSGLIHERIYLGDFEIYREILSGDIELERETLHISDETGRIALVDTLTVDEGDEVTSPTSTIRYQFSNHLGSASLELDDSANIISYEEYHPFGSTSYRSGVSSAEVSLKRYRYVGKERDEETGLYYYGARYYAAWLARFISVDPLKDDYPYYTSYQYAGNKPITFIDLDGLEEADPQDDAMKKLLKELSQKGQGSDSPIKLYVNESIQQKSNSRELYLKKQEENKQRTASIVVQLRNPEPETQNAFDKFRSLANPENLRTLRNTEQYFIEKITFPEISPTIINSVIREGVRLGDNGVVVTFVGDPDERYDALIEFVDAIYELGTDELKDLAKDEVKQRILKYWGTDEEKLIKELLGKKVGKVVLSLARSADAIEYLITPFEAGPNEKVQRDVVESAFNKSIMELIKQQYEQDINK